MINTAVSLGCTETRTENGLCVTYTTYSLNSKLNFLPTNFNEFVYKEGPCSFTHTHVHAAQFVV